MTSSVPDYVSFADLTNLLEQRVAEEAVADFIFGEEDDVQVISDFEEHCLQVAHAALDEAITHIPDPMVHKVMALICISNICKYHEALAAATREQAPEASETANAWQKDAGKLQAAHEILRSVVVGDNDFTAE